MCVSVLHLSERSCGEKLANVRTSDIGTCKQNECWFPLVFRREKKESTLLACITHHVDGARARRRLALLLGVAQRLVVKGLLDGEQRVVDQLPHQDGVDGAEETSYLGGRNSGERDVYI